MLRNWESCQCASLTLPFALLAPFVHRQAAFSLRRLELPSAPLPLHHIPRISTSGALCIQASSSGKTAGGHCTQGRQAGT